jgi:toxin ParE1/3/4
LGGIGRRARQDISPSLRSFVKRRYLIYYEPTNQGIDILRILHGSQEQDRILRGE